MNSIAQQSENNQDVNRNYIVIDVIKNAPAPESILQLTRPVDALKRD